MHLQGWQSAREQRALGGRETGENAVNEETNSGDVGQQQTELTVRSKRGAIVDRNGHELAVSAMVPSL